MSVLQLKQQSVKAQQLLRISFVNILQTNILNKRMFNYANQDIKQKMNSKNYVITISFFLFVIYSVPIFGQNGYHDFGMQSYKIQNTGMYVLGSWALLNMASGAYGWAKLDGEQKYFYQMNFLWNTVNAGIAGYALYNNFHTEILAMEPKTILLDHQKMERILLINVGLDITYMAAGYFFAKRSEKATKQSQLLKGYGNSIVLQGAFLFGFDLVLWCIMRSERLQFLQNLSLSYMHDGLLLNFTHQL